ncbi:MAG: NlpC/P60 family protein [Actinomycetota bacterium]
MADTTTTETIDDAPAEPDLDERASLARFVQAVSDQYGDRFEYGAEVDLDDPDPDAFDSSELVEWAAHQAGADLPDGSWRQYKHLAGDGHGVSVDEAANTPGALLFWFSDEPFEVEGRPRISHVAVSLGEGVLVEATTGTDRTVRIESLQGRFTHAAVIPEFEGQTLTDDQVNRLLEGQSWQQVDHEVMTAVDTTDPLPPEEPAFIDTDGDGLSDAHEEARDGDPTKFDSDGDGLSDGVETMLRAASGEQRQRLDTDGDGLWDEAERRHGTDLTNADTDGDGMLDSLEVLLGTDPLVVEHPDRPVPEGGSEHGSEAMHRGFEAMGGVVRDRIAELDARDQLLEEFEEDEPSAEDPASAVEDAPDQEAGAPPDRVEDAAPQPAAALVIPEVEPADDPVSSELARVAEPVSSELAPVVEQVAPVDPVPEFASDEAVAELFEDLAQPADGLT